MQQMNHLVNIQNTLTIKLGAGHKYFNLLKSQSEHDSHIDFIITTICQDPEIHALYFPVDADVDFEIKETFCRHELCRLDTPPKKHVMQAYWNSISKPQ
jgi:hypothetical protein